MPSLAPAHTLGRLRQAVAEIDSKEARLEEAGSLSLGLPAVDDALEGGLACGALHEFAPAEPGSAGAGAACGFALAVAARAAAAGQGRSVLLIQTDFGVLETGAPYGPGLAFFGLPLERLLCLRVARPLDALWAFEEALKSPSLAAVFAELPQDGTAADLTATRRLALAARAGSGLGLLVRQRPSPEPTAALTRWAVASAPGTPDEFGGLGRTAFNLSLSKNRRGRCGRFRVWWNHGDRCFDPEALTTALSRGVAAPARDRPDHAPFVRARAG
jgi:protein ImuA